MNRRAEKRRASFTLIELLVVVAIILILLGISLRVMALVNRRGSAARTTWIIEQVKNALGGYYSLYGTYPPVSSVPFVYEGYRPPPPYPPGFDWRYSTGLVYYIYSEHNPSADKWRHYLNEIGSSGLKGEFTVTPSVSWSNRVHTIGDAWGNTIIYQSQGPDYQRYRLYSRGPNGTDEGGGGDDIGIQWTD